MANPRDIRFRKQGKVVTVRIKVGGQWLDRSGGWRTIEEATGPAIEMRDKLQAATPPPIQRRRPIPGIPLEIASRGRMRGPCANGPWKNGRRIAAPAVTRHRERQICPELALDPVEGQGGSAAQVAKGFLFHCGAQRFSRWSAEAEDRGALFENDPRGPVPHRGSEPKCVAELDNMPHKDGRLKQAAMLLLSPTSRSCSNSSGQSSRAFSYSFGLGRRVARRSWIPSSCLSGPSTGPRV